MTHYKKVLITGGAGYIGSHTVVELHAAGYVPVIVDNFSNSKRGIVDRISQICGEEIRMIEADCRDLGEMVDVFDRLGPLHAVMHFAAFKAVGESVEKPVEYYINNISSLANILLLMRENGVQGMVFSSSCTVYGQPDVLPVTEDSPIQPASSPYGFTKQVCEQLIQDAVKSKAGLRAVTLRYFNPIGAHPSGLIGELPIGVPNNLVPYITQAAAGLRGHLKVFGNDYATPDGTAVRDYIHVVDLAKAHVQALALFETAGNQSFNKIANIATGRGASVLEVVKTFEKVSGNALQFEFAARRPGDVAAVWAAATNETSLPGWKPAFTLEDAMRDAWRWQQSLATNPI